jgi:hypothetical protein
VKKNRNDQSADATDGIANNGFALDSLSEQTAQAKITNGDLNRTHLKSTGTQNMLM